MDDQAFEFLKQILAIQDVRLANIEKKVDDLNAWKWKTVGVTSFVSAAVTLAVTYYAR